MEPNMIPDRDHHLPRRQRRSRGLKSVPAAALAALATLGMLGGCSAVPDWADPVGWFAEDAAPTKVGLAEGQARTQPTGFPNLASVPNQPPKILSLEARAEVQASLAADRANAVYSGEKLTGSAPILASAAQTAAARSNTAQAVSEAPPAPMIGSELTAALRVPPAPAVPAQTQVAQIQVAPAPVAQAPVVAQAQVAQAAGGRTQLRFPQFQNRRSQAAVPSAVGVQLVAVIYFGHSSSRLDSKDRAVLRDVVALRRQRGATIRVVGHASAHTAVTDQISHDLTNFEMSLKRANSVAAELIALGAARDQVRAEARSDKQPVYHEFMTTGQAGNRRVEIFLEN
jgi:outer membrane protein OmpA-like peptidoglycan-associated protein